MLDTVNISLVDAGALRKIKKQVTGNKAKGISIDAYKKW